MVGYWLLQPVASSSLRKCRQALDELSLEEHGVDGPRRRDGRKGEAKAWCLTWFCFSWWFFYFWPLLRAFWGLFFIFSRVLFGKSKLTIGYLLGTFFFSRVQGLANRKIQAIELLHKNTLLSL